MPQASRHHLFYPRRLWQGGCRKQLREHTKSIIIIDRGNHNQLHQRLHSTEHLFRPRIEVVLGMLALAEEFDGPDSLTKTLDLIRAQAAAARSLDDKTTQKMLGRQLPWIERGYIGGKGRPGD